MGNLSRIEASGITVVTAIARDEHLALHDLSRRGDTTGAGPYFAS